MTVRAQNVSPPTASSQLRWKIDRDPSDVVGTGTPSLSALTGEQITVTPNTAGNFRLICYFDLNGNSSYDAGEELRVLRLAVVRMTVDTSTQNSSIDASLSQTGQENGVLTSTAMALNFAVLLEGGGTNRMIGVNLVHIGDVGNLTADNSTINYPVPSPSPGPPGDVAGTET